MSRKGSLLFRRTAIDNWNGRRLTCTAIASWNAYDYRLKLKRQTPILRSWSVRGASRSMGRKDSRSFRRMAIGNLNRRRLECMAIVSWNARRLERATTGLGWSLWGVSRSVSRKGSLLFRRTAIDNWNGRTLAYTAVVSWNAHDYRLKR
jgi:hypothetical protein